MIIVAAIIAIAIGCRCCCCGGHLLRWKTMRRCCDTIQLVMLDASAVRAIVRVESLDASLEQMRWFLGLIDGVMYCFLVIP